MNYGGMRGLDFVLLDSIAERPKLSHLVTQLLKNIEANSDRLSCLQKQPCFKLLFHLNKGLGLIIHATKLKHHKTNTVRLKSEL